MDTPRSAYLTFSRADRRHLLRALAQAYDARLYRRLRAAVAQIAEGEPVAVVAKHARVERSTVCRWIERYLAERAPCSLADGKRSSRPRMTPALTHAVQQILARIPVAAHLATYLGKLDALPEELGAIEMLLADTAYFSDDNMRIVWRQTFDPLTAMGWQLHHPSLAERPPLGVGTAVQLNKIVMKKLWPEGDQLRCRVVSQLLVLGPLLHLSCQYFPSKECVFPT